MTLRLTEIRDLAYRFVPGTAADSRFYGYGPHSWWPAHEIGHFLVASRAECRQPLFGLDFYAARASRSSADQEYRYVISREIAAISVSQRMLRRSGHTCLANEEIEYTDENTLECGYERWCKRAVDKLLRVHRIVRLPATFEGLEALLTRKTREVGTTCSRRAAETGQACQTN
jgi:hypothetical protein